MILKKPKAIIFDLDDTVYNYRETHKFALNAVKSKLKVEYGIPKKIFQQQYNLENLKIKKLLKNTASSHNKFLYFKNILESLKFSPYINTAVELENLYWENFYDFMTPFDGLREFLEDIRLMNISVGIVTNFNSIYQFRKILCLGFEDNIDYLVSSEEVGSNKPNQKPFQKIIKLLDIKKSENWMIGDSIINDIEPAKKIMNSITFLIETNEKNNKNNPCVDYTFNNYFFMKKILSKAK